MSLPKAKSVFHHDDPPCKERLTEKERFCPKCKIHPDMQSLAIYFYCPPCDIPLRELECSSCKKRYERPG